MSRAASSRQCVGIRCYSMYCMTVTERGQVEEGCGFILWSQSLDMSMMDEKIDTLVIIDMVSLR